MNPAMNAGVSGGLSGAIVTIINSWFIAFHFAPMTADVATSYAVVLTAGLGYFFHTRSLSPGAITLMAPKVAAPIAPAVAALLLVAILGSSLLFTASPAYAAAYATEGGARSVAVPLVLSVVAIAIAVCLIVVCFKPGEIMKRFIFAIVLAASLAGCASSGSVGGNSGPLPTATQLPQLDPQKVSYYLQAAGCITAEAAAVAAPVVQVIGDGKGNAVLAATGAGASVACRTSVPVAAVAAPAPAAAPVAPATPAPVAPATPAPVATVAAPAPAAAPVAPATPASSS